MSNIQKEISSYIKSVRASGRMLLYRSDEELAFLNQWLLQKPEHDWEPAANVEEKSLAVIAESCEKCKNVENKKQGRGTGSNGVFIILNMPCEITRIDKKKFLAESKELLKKMLAAINIELKDSYITNMIKCDAKDPLTRPSLMFNNCESILKREIIEMNPSIIIVMGDDTPVKKKMNEDNKINWFKINHPVSLIKNPELKKPAWDTLQKVMALLNESQ